MIQALSALVGFLDTVFPEPAYEGGYSYKVRGEWVWFPARQWQLEVPAAERTLPPKQPTLAAHVAVPKVERTYTKQPIYGQSPADDMYRAMTERDTW